MLLKVVMSPLEPSVGFVEQYIRLVQDTDTSELAKLLEMKGVKRSEHSPYLELYREQHTKMSPVESSSGAGAGSPVTLSPAHHSSGHHTPDHSKIAKLEKLIKNRL